MNLRKLCLAILPLLLTACATTNQPTEIATNVKDAPTVADVLADGAAAYQGERVRWGGTIASVKNKQDETWIEVVAHDLSTGGRPKRTDQTDGRFIIKTREFVEPEIYQKGREVTVAGKVEGSEPSHIGARAYDFPVVVSEKMYLWPVRQNAARAINWGWSYYGGRWGVSSRHAWPFFAPPYPYYRW